MVALSTIGAAKAPVVLDFQSSDESPVPNAVVQELTNEAGLAWASWQQSFDLEGLRAPEPIRVRFQAVDGLAGRSRENEIQLGRSLTGKDLVSVFRHELAHVFLNRQASAKCRGAVPSEIFSETFSLWASGDESRIGQSGGFSFASQARDYLRDRLSESASAKPSANSLFHQSKAAQALSRLVAEARRLHPSGPKSLDSFFLTALYRCDFSPANMSVALFGESQKVALSKESVLVIDGISGETLLNVGTQKTSQFPVASIIKPFIIAEFPEFQRAQTSKATLEWLCPEKAPGIPWTWPSALALSCNGFFLDSDRPGKESVRKFTSRLRKFGFTSPDELSTEQMIGLHPGITASLESVLAYYSWLSGRAPEVIKELQGTAINGTLSGLLDSSWFSRNQIGLKSGTIRNVHGEPEHGWIVAIGPKSDLGRPTFLAAIHQRGSSPQILLSRLRAHLQEVLSPNPLARLSVPAAKVQILGLVPRASISARCENQMLVNGSDVTDSRSEPGKEATFELSGLSDGTKLRCDRGPVMLKYPRPGGFSERSYWGEIELSAPPSALKASAPSVRQARARRGSEVLLVTSERSYIAGVLASEFPSGRAESLKALALVVKFNLKNASQFRHQGRPICDTTHCQVFGTRNRDEGARPGEKYSNIAQEIAGLNLVGELKDPWLMFSIGGAKSWSKEIPSDEVKELLKLQQVVHSIQRGNGPNEIARNSIVVTLGPTGQGIRRTFPCEKFRNLLHLPSCPDQASPSEENSAWIFEGAGEGHGFGMDLIGADRLAAEGRTSREILRTYFPGLEVR